jgi:hypothetical protein
MIALCGFVLTIAGALAGVIGLMKSMPVLAIAGIVVLAIGIVMLVIGIRKSDGQSGSSVVETIGDAIGDILDDIF